MSRLKDIRKRIDSVKRTQKTTSAMKMVSAAKLRRAEDHIREATPYAQKLKLLSHHSAHALKVKNKLLALVISSGIPVEKELVLF